MGNALNFGYVSFVNGQWLGLANILVDHINVFSKYKIQLYTINCDAEFDYPCLIKKRIDIKNESKTNICYTKIFASFNNCFDFGLVLDGDMIPLPNIDDVIEKNLKFIEYKYPICAVHPHSPPKDKATIRSLNETQKRLGFIHPIKKYSYASYLFSKNSFEFLKNCYGYCQDLEKVGARPISNDEAVLNLMLAQIEDYEDIGYNYLPNYYAYDDFIAGKTNSEHIKNYTDYGCKLVFNILHGCKHEASAKALSNYVKETKEAFYALTERR